MTLPLRAGVVAVFLLALAGPARADMTVSDLQNVRPSADAQLAAETQLAVDFWRARNVTACPTGITTLLADFPGLQNDGGLDCAIYFDAWTIAKRRVDGRLYQVDNEGECTLVVHEVGHAMGLDHTATGVMAPVAEAPWECKVFVRELARRDQRPARRCSGDRDRRRGARRACRSRA